MFKPPLFSIEFCSCPLWKDNLSQGYTPLHIAMQFNHLAVYKLLIDVYGANKDLRDWSGKKPIHYFNIEKTNTAKVEGYRSEYKAVRTMHVVTLRDTKHQSFLRKSFTPAQKAQRRAKTIAVNYKP